MPPYYRFPRVMSSSVLAGLGTLGSLPPSVLWVSRLSTDGAMLESPGQAVSAAFRRGRLLTLEGLANRSARKSRDCGLFVS